MNLSQKNVQVMVYFFLFFSFCSLSHKVQADMLGPNEKQITGYVRFEGRDSVRDYIIVEPIFSEWGADCESKEGIQSFYIVSDGNVENLGFGSHSAESVRPVAIERKYLSDIKFVGPFQDSVSYVLSCDSEGYKNAYIGEAKLPNLFKYDNQGNILESDAVLKSDPTIRRDFIVTFQGIDQAAGKLKMSVSKPIIRTAADKKEADAFVLSMQKAEVINGISPYIKQNVTPENIEPTNIKKKPEVLSYRCVDDDDKSDIIWNVVSYLSVAVAGGIIGFIIDKKRLNKKYAADKGDIK